MPFGFRQRASPYLPTLKDGVSRRYFDENRMDFDEGFTIMFNNGNGYDDEEIKDLKKISKLWDRMFSSTEKIDVKGKTQSGQTFEIYITGDSSGFDYWRNDGYFSMRPNISFGDGSNELTDKDIKVLAKGLDAVLGKASNNVRKYLSQIEKYLDAPISLEQ